MDISLESDFKLCFWFGFVCFGFVLFVLVSFWFGLVWFGLVWFCSDLG
jgi:hypothetical protein